MWAPSLAQIELSRLPTPPVLSTDLSLLLAAASLAAILGTLAWVLWSRRQDREAFEGLARRFGVEPSGERDRATVEDAVGEVFGEGPRVTQLLRHRVRELDVYVARLRMPLYRVDEGGAWDETLQEAQRKLVVVVSGFAGELPAFRLMPNNWALSTVRGKEDNAFQNVMPFGFRNYVLGQDKDALMHLLGGPVQRMLRDNKHLTLDGRRDYLAFYLQDNRESPRDLAAFVERCIEVAAAIGERVKIGAPR